MCCRWLLRSRRSLSGINDEDAALCLPSPVWQARMLCSTLSDPLISAEVDWEMDLQCSSIFVPLMQRDGLLYGTRSQTVAAVWASGKIEVQERSLSEDGAKWNHTSLTSSLARACNSGGTVLAA
jgi:uncharacterized protein with NRDE domain